MSILAVISRFDIALNEVTKYCFFSLPVDWYKNEDLEVSNA